MPARKHATSSAPADSVSPLLSALPASPSLLLLLPGNASSFSPPDPTLPPTPGEQPTHHLSTDPTPTQPTDPTLLQTMVMAVMMVMVWVMVWVRVVVRAWIRVDGCFVRRERAVLSG